jgi:hypothetical protein
MVLNFNQKSPRCIKKKGWMILAAVFLLVFKRELGNGVGAAKLCLAIKAKMCRAGTARRNPSLKIMQTPVAKASSLRARTGKMPVPPKTFPSIHS